MPTDIMWSDVRRRRWTTLGISVFVVALLAAMVAEFGPKLGDVIVASEQWISDQGVWGPLVFTGAFILLTSLFVPDSLLAAIAGALFGIPTGFAVAMIGVVAAQCIAFGVSRHFLHEWVHRVLTHRPQLSAIERAADRGGMRLQLLLRLVPLNPVAVSHVIGTTRVRFLTFLVGCVGLIPHVFLEAYCGYTAKHMIKVSSRVSEHSTLHTVVMLSGLVVFGIVIVYVTRLARAALAESELTNWNENERQPV